MDVLIPISSDKDIKVCYKFTLNKELKTLYYVCVLDLKLDDVKIEPYYYIIAKNVPRNKFEVFDKLSRDINWYAYVAYDMVTFLGNDCYLMSHTSYTGKYFYQTKTKATPSHSQPNSSLKTPQI